ncbi:cytochrome P450 [Mucor ambiguus]|uniref:Cytochrome P450 n=1 Tax=Mucor ambiguus TaxID=91626 RepID=A0A0C9MRZ0_9FUNG|nr:cytochrome P450 [Mucor ambiguus]
MSFVTENLKYLDEKFVKVCLPCIKDNKKTVVSISAAVTVSLLAGYVYRLLTIPPKQFNGLPCITYIDLVKSILCGDLIYAQRKKLALPLLDKAKGVFVEPSHVGWQIRSTNPIINKAILNDSETFPKADDMFGREGSLIYKFIGGKHVGSLEGAEWRRHRKIINPAFHKALPISTFGQLSQKAMKMMETLGLENLCVADVCGRMTLDAIGVAGFGFDFECVSVVDNEWIKVYDNIRENLADPFFVLFQIFDDELKWMFPHRVAAHKDLDKLLGSIDKVVMERKAEMASNNSKFAHIPDAEKDILTLMLEAEQQGEGKLSDLELKRNIAGFFLAGHDTTAISLAFAIAQMGRNKDIQKKAREEVLSVLGDEPEDVLPTKEDFKEMKYLDAVIKETLRLNSPLSKTLNRVAARDVEIEGLLITKGTSVDIDITATHMSWEDGQEFKPERFLGAIDPTSNKHGTNFATFGGGSHTCPGMNFSYAEQRVFLSMFLRKFEWDLVKDTIHKDECIGEGYGSVKPLDLRIDLTKRY